MGLKISQGAPGGAMAQMYHNDNGTIGNCLNISKFKPLSCSQFILMCLVNRCISAGFDPGRNLLFVLLAICLAMRVSMLSP